MKEPFLARSTIAGTPAIELDWLARAPQLLSFSTRLLPWASLAAIVGFGLFLRLYGMDGVITYYPDSYSQLRAVENLLSADFPLSYLYPPGVALFLAPFFAVLPNTLTTLQAAVTTAGIALIVVAYAASRATTGDGRAALFFAAAVAIGTTFVFYSRVAFFDVINTLLIALSLFLAPAVARRGPAALLPYGLLVFATVTVRFTNLIILPALLLASLAAGTQPLSFRLVLDQLRSRATLTVGFIVAALYAAYVATTIESLTRFSNAETGSIVDFGGYLPRLGQYIQANLTGSWETFSLEAGLLAMTVLIFAAVGAHRLWHTNRGLLIPIAFLILVWSPVHAVYEVFNSRYVMPSFFLVLLLATLGLSVGLQWWRTLERPWQRVGLATLLACGVTLYAARQISQDLLFYQDWPEGREVAYNDLRIVLSDLEGDRSVLVSSQSLAVDRANPAMTNYDLLVHSETYGINSDSTARLVSYVEERHAEGKTVYYHYTEFEDVQSRFRKYELGFDAYFAALQREFSVRELVRSPSADRVQRIYAIEPPTSGE